MESFRYIRVRRMARLLQSIYGLKQSNRLWNQKEVAFFTSLRFRIINIDLSIFIQHEEKDEITIVSIYVVDFLFAAKYQKLLNWIKERLKKKYNVKDLGEMKTII